MVDVHYEIERVNEILEKMETFFTSPRVNYPPKGSSLKMETICLNMYAFKGNHASVLSMYYWDKRIRIYAIANKWKSFMDLNGYGDCEHSWGTVISNTTDIHIRNIPINELKNITNIDLEIVIEKGDPNEGRRMRWDIAFPREGCN